MRRTNQDQNQVSFFDADFVWADRFPAVAFSMFNGEKHDIFPIEQWMKNILPQGEYYLLCAGHPLVLCQTAEVVPPEMLYRHYKVGSGVYAATGVGRGLEDEDFEEE